MGYQRIFKIRDEFILEKRGEHIFKYAMGKLVVHLIVKLVAKAFGALNR